MELRMRPSLGDRVHVITVIATNLSHAWVTENIKIAFDSICETFAVDMILSKPTGLKHASQQIVYD